MAAELSWAEAFGRMQAVGFSTVHGRMRYRTPSGNGVQEGVVEFWHQPPEKWRVEDGQGLWHLHDGQRLLIRTTDGMELMSPSTAMKFPREHPQALFGVPRGTGLAFDWMHDFTTPLGPGTPVEVVERHAWEFELAASEHKRARKPYPLRVAVDASTGTPLRMSMPEAAYFMEIVEFEPDCALPQDIFTWSGTPSTKLRDVRERDMAKKRWVENQQLPMPRWWPGGVGYHSGDGDPDTGAFQVMLEVPGLPELVRWPRQTPMPGRWSDRHKGRHVHRWSDQHWEWALAIAEPLDDHDLAKVIDSIPHE